MSILNLDEYAFPLKWETDCCQTGMTLRDYFAAKALTISPIFSISDKAAWAYKMADAMLEAREK